MISHVAIIISLLAYVQSAPAVATPPNCGSYGLTSHNVKWTTVNSAVGYSSLSKTFGAVNICCAGACCSSQFKATTLARVKCNPIVYVKGKTGALKTVARTNACVLDIVCGGVGDKTFVSGTISRPPAGINFRNAIQAASSLRPDLPNSAGAGVRATALTPSPSK